MSASTTLLYFVLTVVAGLLLRRQATMIDYLNADNGLLRERLGGVTFRARKVRHRMRKWWPSEGLIPHIVSVTLTLLVLGASTSFAGEDYTMKFVETYKGHIITITTTRASEGGWTANARIVMSGDKIVTVEPDRTDNPGGKSFRSEEDAKAAALRAAVTTIDRSRVSIGKP
jgi:hypothetical protein